MAKANGQAAKSSALTAAAAALEDELRRYATLSSNAVKMPLTSEKGIERAAKAIAEAAESQQRISGHVKSLIEAINEARETQQTSATTLSERADLIVQRRNELAALLARFGKLGEVGQALNAGLQKVVAYKPDPYGASAESKEVRDALEAIANGLATCAEHAEQLATEAQGLDFDELSRQADALRQQILSTKNRLSLVQKAFAN